MRSLIGILVLLVIALPAFAEPPDIVLYADDTDIDQTASLATTYASFAQMTDTSKVSCLLADGTDSVRVLISGVRQDSSFDTEYIRVAGTDSVHSVKQWMFLESAEIDSGLALQNTLTICQRDTRAVKTQIAAGKTAAPVAHFFSTKYDDAVALEWQAGVASTEAPLTFEVRWYYDWRASRGTTGTTGYKSLGKITLTNVLGTSQVQTLNFVIPHPPMKGKRSAGWLAIYAGATSADNADGWCRLRVKNYSNRR